MNKFIILGCGYLGTNIANYICKKKNTKVYVIGIENEYTDYLNQEVIFISKMIEQINEEDGELFKKAIVIDAVGNINATNNSKNSSMIFLNNCVSKVNLIQLLNNLGISKYIFLSSGGTVYNDSSLPHKEEEKLNPQNVYALEKIIIENYLKIVSIENTGFSYLILRLSNPYGGIVSKNKKQGLIDVTISKLLKNETISLYGKVSNIRDYIFIDDVSSMLYQLAISKYKNDIYNVGTGLGKSISEVFEIIESIFERRIIYNIQDNKTININTNILDVSKIIRDIDYKPNYNLVEGINKIKMNININNK